MDLYPNDYAVTKDNSGKYLIEAGENQKAHNDDVNCVVWHPTKNILASCSDDNTIKLWIIKEIQK